MALATTTLSSPLNPADVQMVVASATGLFPGMLVKVDGETLQVTKAYTAGGTQVPVLHGLDGSMTTAHKSGANVTFGTAADWAPPPPTGVVSAPMTPILPIYSYSATGAITPSQGIHILNGTSALAMTLASPGKDQDGQLLVLCNGGKVAHTITYAAGFGGNGGSSDVLTFNAAQTGAVIAVAVNGAWNLCGSVAGAATVAGPGLA